MKVLRISFLSGFALELAASLSVALIAVTIGFRLIDGLIPFSTAMFLLIMAPEAYLPIRLIGSNYHASSEGIAAASKVLNIIDENDRAIFQEEEFVPGLEVWLGPSGVGKSQRLEKKIQGKAGETVAWMPQQPSLLPGSVEFNIVGGEVLDRNAFDWAIDFAELGTIDRKLEIDDYGRGLSGGQAQRVSLARALYRLKTRNLEKLLLDEPTSSIDLETATKIWSKLSKLAKGGVMVIAVTHQENFAPLANRVVRFEA